MTDFFDPHDLNYLLHRQVYVHAAALACSITTGIIRGYTRQHLTFVENDSVQLPVRHGVINLPERPVVGDVQVDAPVGGVAYRDGNRLVLPWWRTGRDRIFPGATTGIVTVVYSHGYQVLPDDLVAVAQRVGVKVYSNSESVRQEAMGDTSSSYSYDDVLTPLDVSILDNYKINMRSVALR